MYVKIDYSGFLRSSNNKYGFVTLKSGACSWLVKMKNIVNSPPVLSEERHIHKIEVAGQPLSIEFSRHINELTNKWPSYLEGCNVMMSREYLGAIEMAPPSRIGFLYAAVLDQRNSVIGYFYFQYKPFNAAKSLNYTIENSLWQKMKNRIKKLSASMIQAYGLVSGNLLVTGNHGVMWKEKSMTESQKTNILSHVQFEALQFSNAHHRKIGFVLGKDYENIASKESLIDWNSVRVQPNMMLYLRNEWDSMDDYLADMRSKYRKRIRSAQRKVSDFEFVEVGVEEIENNLDYIYKLYLEIVDRAPFNMFVLSRQYFVDIKRNLSNECDYTFVYKDKELIAFQINISNRDEYEAHFLGYSHEYLTSHDLYLNLLLNSVDLAIKRRKKAIVFSRTAMQIKSSIGAVPEDLYLYLNIQNSFLNGTVKQAFKYFNPPVVFDQRHPFKDD